MISWGDASLYKVISMILKLWERFDSTEAISGGLLMIGRVEIYLARKFNVLEEEISVLAYFPSMLGNRNVIKTVELSREGRAFLTSEWETKFLYFQE